MKIYFPVPERAAEILKSPLAFSLQVLKAFQANQGLLLAGAVAYYALLSIVPLLILMVIVLSHVIDQAELLATLRRALEFVVPGQSKEVVQELRSFLENSAAIGWVLFATMLFFSSLAFKVLENAMSVIFLHRIAVKRRPLAYSLLLPFGYILFIGALLFVGTYMLADLLAIGKWSIVFEGHTWSLGALSSVVLYIGGVAGEILIISSIYYFMPVGRLSISHALIGGATAGILWEIVRHGLMWYFSTLSQVSVVYGSLTTAIIVLLSFEIVATLLLFGAQVIAEYERIGEPSPERPPQPAQISTEPA
jgi:YihY family inner membrane protein